MMKKIPENTNHEIYLSQWMVGEVTDDQLRERVSEADFKAYQKLRFSLQSMALPEPNLERNFSSIQQKVDLKKNRKKTKVKLLYVYTSVAAILLLCLGLYQLLVFSNTVLSGYGSSRSTLLSDGSQVVLNANSKISYPSLFRYNRNLKLSGEAYFHVAKGSTFTVETSQGKVQVLGTQFDVNVQPDFLEVHCFEGKVKVTTCVASIILTRDESVRIFKQKVETWNDQSQSKPGWITGESSFRNAPLKVVIAQFENQFHSQVDFPESLSDARFTGSFTHRDRKTALQSICLPLRLNYTKTDSGTLRITE